MTCTVCGTLAFHFGLCRRHYAAALRAGTLPTAWLHRAAAPYNRYTLAAAAPKPRRAPAPRAPRLVERNAPPLVLVIPRCPVPGCGRAVAVGDGPYAGLCRRCRDIGAAVPDPGRVTP